MNKEQSLDYRRIIGRIHLVAFDDRNLASKDMGFHDFRINKEIRYNSFCRDFGPMNLGSLFDFCNKIDFEPITTEMPVALVSSSTDRKMLTNHVCLMDSFLIMKCDQSLKKYKIPFKTY